MFRARDYLKAITPNWIRRKLLESRLAIRFPTSGLRVLPDFVIIGAMRAGTSSLFQYLSSHPSIIGSIRKETWYFSIDKYFEKGEAWYRSHFPTRHYLELLKTFRGIRPFTFEASANYLFYPPVPERMSRVIPDSKLVVLLRNPVDRAISHYFHNIRRGVEKRSFETAIEHGLSLSQKERENIRDHPAPTDSHRSSLYILMGFYADQLEQWFRFYPRDRFLILKSEDFFSRIEPTYKQVLDFIGASDWKPKAFRNYSYWGMSKEKKDRAPKEMNVSDRTKAILEEVYAPYNLRLTQLLGPNFRW